VERFELFAEAVSWRTGSRSSRPHDQRQRFEQQMELRARTDLEAQVLDEDYLARWNSACLPGRRG